MTAPAQILANALQSAARFFLLALVLAVSPVLLAVEPVTEYPAQWNCDVRRAPNGDRICIPRCINYDGTRVWGDIEWVCPGSYFFNSCANSACVTEQECRQFGIPYVRCHDREDFVCTAKARRETRATCPTNGPPGSAVKFGDCVLRVIKDLRRNKVSIHRNCFDIAHDYYAHSKWEPTHPEELLQWFYTQGNTDPAYPKPPPPPPVDICDVPNPDSRFCP